MATSKPIFKFLSQNLVDDVVLSIYQKVHKDIFQPVVLDIKNYKSVFEIALENNEDPILELTNSGYDVKSYVDDWFDWGTVLISFDNKFVFIHDYLEMRETDTFIVEGLIDEKSMKIDRLYYHNDYRQIEYTSLKELTDNNIEKKIYNMIPFEWTMDVLIDKRVEIDYSYQSNKKWNKPSKIIDWFKKHLVTYTPIQ